MERKIEYTVNNHLFAIIESYGRSYVNLSDVVRLVADGSCTWVFFRSGDKIITTKNLGYYEELLPHPQKNMDNTFFRTHHKHLINLSFMKKYNSKEKYVCLIGDERIPVAQRRITSFTAMLKQFGLY